MGCCLLYRSKERKGTAQSVRGMQLLRGSNFYAGAGNDSFGGPHRYCPKRGSVCRCAAADDRPSDCNHSRRKC